MLRNTRMSQRISPVGKAATSSMPPRSAASSRENCSSDQLGFLAIPLIVLPTFLLSGIFWPLEAMPLWLRPVPYFIPPFYAIDACRSILVRGWGLDRVWPELAALAGFALLFLVASALALRRRP